MDDKQIAILKEEGRISEPISTLQCPNCLGYDTYLPYGELPYKARIGECDGCGYKWATNS